MILNEELIGLSEDKYAQKDEFSYYYTIYRLTNLQNGRFYIGAHKTTNLNDYYYGSGLCIKSAIQKYGTKSFKKEYLFFLRTEKEMYEKEREIVNPEFIRHYKGIIYNLVVGGVGGAIHKDRSGEYFTFNGRTLTWDQWSKLYSKENHNLSGNAIKVRIKERNWDPYKAMTTPFQPISQTSDIYFTYKEETNNLRYFARKYHVGLCALHHRIFYNKMTIEDAIQSTRKVKAKKLWNKHNTEIVQYEFNGEKHSLKEWAEIKHIRLKTLVQRLKRDKFTIEEALSLEVKFGNNQNLRNIPLIRKPLTEEQKKKIKESHKNLKVSQKQKDHMSELGKQTKEKVWITDGIRSKRINKNESLPTGFRYGKVFKKSS